MITQADLTVLDWIQENLRCGFLDAVTPFITGLVKPDFYITSSGANIVGRELEPILKRGVDRSVADALIREYGDRLACVIMEPVRGSMPPTGLLEHVRDEIHRVGGLLQSESDLFAQVFR